MNDFTGTSIERDITRLFVSRRNTGVLRKLCVSSGKDVILKFYWMTIMRNIPTEKEISKLLDEGKVVVIEGYKDAVLVTTESRGVYVGL